jgi:hypothetical protein
MLTTFNALAKTASIIAKTAHEAHPGSQVMQG